MKVCTKLSFVLLLVSGAILLTALERPLPKLMSAELPIYPERARVAHIAGTVKLWFVLDSDGGVAQAEVVSGTVLLRDAALQNVKSWKFHRDDGVDQKARYETEFVYKLDGTDKQGEPRLTVSMVDFRHIEISSEVYVQTIY